MGVRILCECHEAFRQIIHRSRRCTCTVSCVFCKVFIVLTCSSVLMCLFEVWLMLDTSPGVGECFCLLGSVVKCSLYLVWVLFFFSFHSFLSLHVPVSFFWSFIYIFWQAEIQYRSLNRNNINHWCLSNKVCDFKIKTNDKVTLFSYFYFLVICSVDVL